MAIFRTVLAVIPRVRQALKKVISLLGKVIRRLTLLSVLISIILLWQKIIDALYKVLNVLRRLIRRLRLIPIPQLRPVLTALSSLIKSLQRLFRPIRRFLNQNKQKLKELKATAKALKAVLKTIRTSIKRMNRKLLLMEILARILEKQQDFLESIMGQKLKAILNALLARLNGLVDALNVLITAAQVIEAALATLLAVIQGLVNRIKAFMDTLKKVLDFLEPLRRGLQRFLDAISKLMENRIVKWILDGFTYVMDKLDQLFQAIMDRIGLNALINRVLSSLPGISGILQALQKLNQKLQELFRKVDELKSKIQEIRKKLEEIEAVMDQIIRLLQALLFYKAIIEFHVPTSIQLFEGETPAFTLNELMNNPNNMLSKIEQEDEVFQQINQLNIQIESTDQLVQLVENAETPQAIFAAIQPHLEELNLELPAVPEEELVSAEAIDLAVKAVESQFTSLSSLVKQLNIPSITPEDMEELATWAGQLLGDKETETDEVEE